MGRKSVNIFMIWLFLIGVMYAQSGYTLSQEKKTYFIDSENGNDANLGTSETLPWKSLSKLMSTKLNAGETVRFKRGSSFTGPLFINDSGNQKEYITLSDYGSQDYPAPSFTNPEFKQGNFGNCIRVKGSFVIIENIFCHHTSAYKKGEYETQRGWHQWEMGAIYIDKGARNCVVRHNETFDCPVGIKSYGEKTLIEYNYVHDCNRVLAEWDWGPIGIWLGADYQEVCYNRIINYRAENPNIKWQGADGGAMEVDDARFDKSHVSIHHNYSRDCQGFLEMTFKDVKTAPKYENFEIHHNISDDYQNFILLWQGANFRIDHNTILRRKRNSNDKGVFNITETDSRNMIRNNIIVVEKNIPVFFDGKRQRTANSTIKNNLYFAASDSLIFGSEGPGESPVFGNPDFVNYKTAATPADYSIKKGSAAIDKGMNLDYTIDFKGTSIPAQERVDIGAFEHK